MDIYSSIPSLGKAPAHSIITIGVFDGCHLGHQALLQKTLDLAREQGVPAGVLTFSSHPDLILHPGKPLRLLTSPEQRLDYFEKMGFDFTAIIPFDSLLRHTSAEKFIRSYLVDALQISRLVLGYDSHFGEGRRGNALLAKKILSPLSIGVETVDAVQMEGPISSTRIRKLLMAADMDGAQGLLGHPYSVIGRVGHGDRRGRKIGFPTANVVVDFDMPLPPGVWAARAQLNNGQSYLTAVHWGTRPTFAGHTPETSRLEAHLLGFEGDIYGTHLKISFIKSIRPELHFSSGEELGEQIKKDIAMVKEAGNHGR